MAMALRPPSALIKATVAASSMEMQSHSTLPLGVLMSSARCPMANCGCVPMPMMPGSCWRQPLKCPAASAGSVVQVCPRGGMNCRSSSQMVHCAGAVWLGGYCVPQAVQMKASIALSSGHGAEAHLPGQHSDPEHGSSRAMRGTRARARMTQWPPRCYLPSRRATLGSRGSDPLLAGRDRKERRGKGSDPMPRRRPWATR